MMVRSARFGAGVAILCAAISLGAPPARAQMRIRIPERQTDEQPTLRRAPGANGAASIRPRPRQDPARSPALRVAPGALAPSVGRPGLTLSPAALAALKLTPFERAGDWLNSQTQPQTTYMLHANTAPEGLYPWMVSIDRAGYLNGAGHFCGGALIAPQWVLTAGHCFPTDDVAASDITVYTGSTDLTQRGVWRQVAKIVRNPRFEFVGGYGEPDYDMALLKLSAPVEDAPVIAMLEDAEAEAMLAPEHSAFIAGWGVTEDGAPSARLLHAEVLMVAKTDCNAPEAYDGHVNERMFCARHQLGNFEASCYGDSGGPVMLPKAEGEGFIVAGVVSWGAAGECGADNKVGVYSYLPSFRPWIEDAMASN